METLAITNMKAAQVKAVASLHARALPNDLLPSLGHKFLERYYETMLDCPYALVLVALHKEKLVGFVNIATAPDKLFRWVLKKKIIRTILACINLSIKNPSRLIEAVAAITAGTPQADNSGEVAFIAVEPNYQKLGIGKNMIAESNRIFKNKGLYKVFTKTLSSNRAVMRFYNENWNAEISGQVEIANKEYTYISWRI